MLLDLCQDKNNINWACARRSRQEVRGPTSDHRSGWWCWVTPEQELHYRGHLEPLSCCTLQLPGVYNHPQPRFSNTFSNKFFHLYFCKKNNKSHHQAQDNSPGKVLILPPPCPMCLINSVRKQLVLALAFPRGRLQTRAWESEGSPDGISSLRSHLKPVCFG